MSGPAFHVTSSLNRESIRTSGLDWSRMGAACGIAGSAVPEQEGVFLSDSEFGADFFVRMNNTGGPVDLWAVHGVDPAELVESPEGFFFLPRTVPPGQVELVRQDIHPDHPC